MRPRRKCILSFLIFLPFLNILLLLTLWLKWDAKSMQKYGSTFPGKSETIKDLSAFMKESLLDDFKFSENKEDDQFNNDIIVDRGMQFDLQQANDQADNFVNKMEDDIVPVGLRQIWHKTHEAVFPSLAFTQDNMILTKEGVSFLKRRLDDTNDLSNTHSDLMSSRNLKVWSINYDIENMFGIRFLLESMGVRFVEHSFSPFCKKLNSCSKGLQVLSKKKAFKLGKNYLNEFYETYKDDAVMAQIDVFLCVYPAAMCELFLPFNKTMLVIFDDRFESGRCSETQITRWKKTFQQIAQNQNNIVMSTNSYDSEYTKYFTAISTEVLRPYCDYVQHVYRPTKQTYLLLPVGSESFQKEFLHEFYDVVESNGSTTITLELAKELYPELNPSKMADHLGLVIIPQDVTMVAFHEYMHQGLPMFFPTSDLLAFWHRKYSVMPGRTRNAERRNCGIDTEPETRIEKSKVFPDPNDENSRESLAFWLGTCEYYSHMHVQFFNSAKGLVGTFLKLSSTELLELSSKMRQYSGMVQKKTYQSWTKIVKNLRSQKDAKGLALS